ncbi:bacillithiol system redox-active protein YtxJ [Desulfosporosinus sp. PR]|uniref:bacillithiol system redox-active protein YtxJ n=1 Tax=Candidatus Desulfosporosinus nitrosoreducens TaxID=3401928 RepID=UPI0027E68755|nr:bacillithiol system redox-active protein YtxJ [Desulfosporosinus sp. PR]MDQ7093469.1 bacillithiol system redox-active protein YtxJ [Desulfosporosinus sp. PR]
MAELKELTTSQDFQAALEESCRRKVLIFKHSTQCPISAHAWQEVRNYLQQTADDVLIVMIKVIESRSLSNQVANDLGIKHESPQVILLRDKNVLWHTSHQAITLLNLIQALNNNG